MKRAAPEVWDCVGQVVESLGFEFVGVRYGQEEGGMVLRVFIDAEDGITIDNCASVSEQLSAVLDVEDLLPAAYSLEVSSPGLDRPLFDAADFQRFIGEQAAIRLMVPHDGRRKFKGELIACAEDQVEIEVDREVYPLPIASIDEANLVHEFKASRARK